MKGNFFLRICIYFLDFFFIFLFAFIAKHVFLLHFHFFQTTNWFHLHKGVFLGNGSCICRNGYNDKAAGMATLKKKKKKKSATNKGQNQVARTHLFHHPVLQITPTQENGCARFFFASFIRSQTPRRTCEQIIGAAVGLRVSGGSRRRRRGNARRRGLDFFFPPLVALICWLKRCDFMRNGAQRQVDGPSVK